MMCECYKALQRHRNLTDQIQPRIALLQEKLRQLEIKRMRHQSANEAASTSFFNIARKAIDIVESPMTFAGELVSTAGSLLGSLLMDQETEETTNLGDRILNERVANTAINSQQSVGRLVAYSTTSDPSPPSSCSDEPTRGSPGSERFYTYKLANWTTTQRPFEAITFTPERRLNNDSTLFGKTQRQHYLTKTGWRAQVQCNASPFHSGSLLVCFIPEFEKVDRITNNSPGVVGMWNNKTPANVRKYGEDFKTWTNTLFYRTMYQDWMTDNDTTLGKGPLSLFDAECTPMWPHQILNLRTSTSVSLEVPYVGCTPTNYPYVHASWTLAIFVLTPLQYAAGAAPTVSVTLSIAPVNPIWNGVRHATLANQGPQPVSVRENAGMFLSTIPDKTTPAYIHSTDPAEYLPGRIYDYVDIAKIPTFVSVHNPESGAMQAYFSISNTVTNNDPVFHVNVLPSDSHLIRTALGRTCLNFTMYSGSLNFDFLFCGTAMMRGKLLISYTPPGSGAPETMDEAMQGTYAVWDLGLNSSYSFNVPYISPSSQRFGFSNIPNELSLEGWLNVYQLTPLTYPPGSPNSAHVVVMVSAGPDFTLYNPYSTMYNQGTDNMETGENDDTPPGEDFESKEITTIPPKVSQSSLQFVYDRSFFAGSFGTMNYTSGDKPQLFALTPFPSISGNHYGTCSGISRYTVGFINNCCFTYFKSDLEVTVIPNGDWTPNSWTVLWFPEGATFPTGTENMCSTHFSRYLLSSQPIARSYGRKPVSFDVPWTSPLSYFPTTYDGWKTLNKQEYATPPVPTWGTITAYENSGKSENARFDVYVRFKNFKAYCPAPYKKCLPNHFRTRSGRVVLEHVPETPIEKEFPTLQLVDETESDYVHDVSLDGDVETNPGPTTFASDEMGFLASTLSNFLSGAHNLSKEQEDAIREMRDALFEIPVKDAIKKMPKQEQKKFKEDTAAFIRFLESEDPIETAVQGWDAIREIQHCWKSLKAMFQDCSFWYDVAVWFLKAVIGSFMFLLNPTPSVALGLTLLTLLDGVSLQRVKRKIIQRLQPLLGPHPDVDIQKILQEKEKEEKNWFSKIKDMFNQGPHDDRVNSANRHFQLVKNVKWLIDALKDLFNWVWAWFRKPELTAVQKLDEMLSLAPSHLENLCQFRQGLLMVPPTESIEFVKKLHDSAFKLGKSHIVNMCSRYLVPPSNEKPRLEPVVIVLRGKPGAGKSVASQILAQAVSKSQTGRQSVYAMPPDSEHMDGYKGQYCVIQDDLGQNPDGEDFATFCQMVSTTNFIPSMAHLEDKGRPFTSRVVIATTNLPEFRPVTIADPGAVERRITFDLEVLPGSECCRSGKLDLEKALENVGPGFGPFTQECMIHHRTGLTFLDLRTHNTYSLIDVFNMIEQELKHKSKVLDKLDALVNQGPHTPSPNDPNPSPNVNGDVKISTVQKLEATVLRYDYSPEELQYLLDEVRQLRHEVAAIDFEQKETLKFFVCLLGAVGLSYVVIKAVKTGADWYCLLKEGKEKEPQREPVRVSAPKFLEDPLDERPYNPAAKKIVPKKLQLEAPSNLDFERAVAAHACAPFYYWPRDGKDPFVQSAVLLVDRFFLVNEHTWMYDFEKFELRGIQYTREECDFVCLERAGVSTDMVVVLLPKGQQFRNNIPKFISRHDKFPTRNAQLTGIDSRGPTFYQGVLLREPQMCEISSGPRQDMFLYRATTAPGFCGAPIIGSCDGKKKIIGIHSAGANGIAGGVTLQIHNIHHAIDYLTRQEAKKLKNEGQIHPLPNGPHIHVPRKTKLRPSIAYPVFKPDASPAVLSGNDPRLDEDVDFDKQVFSKHVANQEVYHKEFTLNTLEYADSVFSQLGKDNSMISVKEAILGMEFLDPMEKDTSPGLPFSQAGVRRTDLIDFENGEILDPVLAETLNEYLSGDFSNHVFQTFLKDEIRSNEKVRRGKTRIVDVPNIAHVIVGRMLLGKFCSHYHASPGIGIGSAIGCNPDIDWTAFAQDLLGYKYVYDIDYSNFDSTHGTGMFELLIKYFFTEANGFDPLVGPYLRSLAVSKHAWMDQRMVIEGGLPSGCSATSVLNTILNNIIIRSLLHLTYPNFSFEDVAVLAYGDDLLVASDFRLDFNKVRDTAAKFTLYKLTTANKQPDFPLESSLTDVIFLKRRFVPHNVSGFVYRPVMDNSTLQTILSYYKPNTMQEKLLSVAQLAVHSGYVNYVKLFQPFVSTGHRVPSWYTLEREWERNFFS
ncbi:polyprotein [Suncus murinus picornavirus]|uniref:Genome polyprotein n=1 Tax=mischivirus E1 TaxID=2870396 RepID=A0A2S1YF40_9PICO|nr:polyprotein [Suncus murinus picornavirus]AWK02669.1 polyprotein [Suncus murinus picornavirus]